MPITEIFPPIFPSESILSMATMASKALQFEIVGRCSVSKAKTAVSLLSIVFLFAGSNPSTWTRGNACFHASRHSSISEGHNSRPARLVGLQTMPQQYVPSVSLLLKWANIRGLRPGQKILDTVGGAHKFQSWNNNLLTDSGGFQMVSLLKLAHITEVCCLAIMCDLIGRSEVFESS